MYSTTLEQPSQTNKPQTNKQSTPEVERTGELTWTTDVKAWGRPIPHGRGLDKALQWVPRKIPALRALEQTRTELWERNLE